MTQPGDSFNKHTTAQQVADAFGDEIKGRYIVVTGTSPGGLGFETARAIATQSPKLLVLASRDPKKNDQAREDILKESPKVDIKTVVLDLSSQASVREAAKEIVSLGNVDVLINNAAVMMCPYSTTPDGLETQFGTNFVGPWLLTNLLLPSLLKTPHPRVVSVASAGHTFSDIKWDDVGFAKGKSYSNIEAYGQSKTGNMLTALGLADKYGKDGLVAISVHPGGIMTNLQRHLTEEDLALFKPFLNEDGSLDTNLFKSIPEGASTTLTAAFDPRMAAVNGSYLVDCQVAGDAKSDDTPLESMQHVQPYGKDSAAAKRLWDITNGIVGESF